MRTLIENYRGFEIYFNTDSEDFYTISEMYDTQQTKKSFSATKKYIDDYIKANQNFISFEVQSYSNIFYGLRTFKIVGQRKDGDFVYLDENGDKLRFSRYNEKNYYLYNKLNEPIFRQIEEIVKQEKELQFKRKELEQSLIKKTLAEYREENFKQ